MRVQHTMNYTTFESTRVGDLFESCGELWLRVNSNLSDKPSFNAVKLDGESLGSFASCAEVVRYTDPVLVLEDESVP